MSTRRTYTSDELKTVLAAARVAQREQDRARRASEFSEALSHVERQTGVSRREIVGANRVATVSRARQDLVLMLRARHWPLSEIGLFLGNRDHTTVIYLLRKAKERRSFDASTTSDTTCSGRPLP